MSKRAQYQAYRLLAMQLGVGLVVAGLWLGQSIHAALAALLGVVATLVPTGWVVWRWFKQTRCSPRQLLGSLALNELIKFTTIGVLGCLFIGECHVAAVPYLTGLMAVYLGYFSAPWIVRQRGGVSR